MHIYPIRGNGVWQKNVGHIVRRLSIFNGRRVAAVVTDDKTEDFRAVEDVLYKHDFTVLHTTNDPNLREVKTFVPLWSELKGYKSPNDITLYCHAKGVTRPASHTSHPWTDLQYELCLDYLPYVDKKLQEFAIIGSLRKIGRPIPNSTCPWHYNGTFFWVRNDAVFSRGWNFLEQHRYGIEAWPGLKFQQQESEYLGASFPVSMELNEPDTFQKVVEMCDEWKSKHTQYHSPIG